ncbi:unnamed protein product, partial [Hymenolepis diminuta]
SREFSLVGETRLHLDYVLQFINDIRHVKSSDNIVADCLSRTDVEAVTEAVDFHSLSEAQKTDTELQEFRNRPTSLHLKDIPLHTTPGLITCDVSTGIPSYNCLMQIFSISLNGVMVKINLAKETY